MAEEDGRGRLTVLTERAGTVTEISQFLTDLEGAYLALYAFDRAWWRSWRPSKRRMMLLDFFMETGWLPPAFGWPGGGPATADSILPEHRLVVARVRVESPGFWEFLASLNPLQQIREYLNDRHARRQDKEFREAAERDRLVLENELVQRQIWEKENAIARERIVIMRELGFSDEEIRQLVWAAVGEPLAQLGKHQDSRLIEGAE